MLRGSPVRRGSGSVSALGASRPRRRSTRPTIALPDSSPSRDLSRHKWSMKSSLSRPRRAHQLTHSHSRWHDRDRVGRRTWPGQTAPVPDGAGRGALFEPGVWSSFGSTADVRASRRGICSPVRRPAKYAPDRPSRRRAAPIPGASTRTSRRRPVQPAHPLGSYLSSGKPRGRRWQDHLAWVKTRGAHASDTTASGVVLRQPGGIASGGVYPAHQKRLRSVNRSRGASGKLHLARYFDNRISMS